MSNRFRHRSTIRCRYLAYTNPTSGVTHRLPMLHVRLVHGNLSFTTVALVDSGSTSTFIPTGMAQALQLNMTATPSDATGAGGVFTNIKSEIEKIFLVKGRASVFDEFQNVKVWIPVKEDAIPYVVLGRDSLFRRYDIEFEERNEKIMLKRHGS